MVKKQLPVAKEIMRPGIARVAKVYRSLGDRIFNLMIPVSRSVLIAGGTFASSREVVSVPLQSESSEGMRNVSLSSYTIEVRKRNARKPELIDDFADHDLLNLFEQFLNAQKAASNDKEQKILLRVRTFKKSGRVCRGVIETGEYGYSSDLVDVESLKVSYSKKPGEAGMLPFFFHVFLPRGEKLGLLILERFGNFGIRGVFAEEFKKFFQQKCSDFSIAFKPIVHPEQLGAYSKHGVVKRLTFRQLQLPKDLCDAYGGIDPKEAYVEYAIVAKRDANLPFLKRILRRLIDKGAGQLHIIEPPHFHSNQVLIEVDLNGHRRTIDVSQMHKIRAYFDVTDRVKIGADGHPTFRTMVRESNKLIDDIWRSLKAPQHAN